ncbi:MAG: hypothetical protein E7473_01570 [Ruminococcaceae bacterium]|nr:hypothetical protein [Oscillospiraceae bacterium]
MKRIISILLTVIMLMSLLPAVSFAAEERETLVYSFLKADNGNVADATLISYNVGNGLLEYHSHNTNHSTSNDFSKWDGATTSPRFSMHVWGRNNTNYNFAAYKIRGIKKGEYTVTLDHAVHTSGTQDVEMYILDGDTTDIKAAINDSANVPVLSDINMYGTSKGKSSKKGTYTAEEDGEHILVFVRRSTSGSQCVIPHKLTLEPYKTAEYERTEENLNETEAEGREIPFTAVAYMTDDTVFVPTAEGDGIRAELQATEAAEIIDATYVNGVYNAKLRTKAPGEAVVEITTTVNGVSHKISKTVTIIEQPPLAPITIEMTQDTMQFEDRSAPSEDWVTEGFSLVLDPSKMTTQASRYTPRYINFADGTTKYFVQLTTGSKAWPSAANSMFTIGRQIFTPGNYKIEFTGVMQNQASDYSVYVNGEYAGDFSFFDANAASSGKEGAAGKIYTRKKTLNTLYLPYGNNEISFRARVKNDNYGTLFFIPYKIELIPCESQEELLPVKIEAVVSDMLPAGESEEISCRVLMSDGSYRLFGPENDGGTDTENGISSITVENKDLADISDIKAPEFCKEDKFSFSVNGKAPGKTVIKVTVKVNGKEFTEELPLNVIAKPTLYSVGVDFDKTKLPVTRKAKTILSLIRTDDFKDYTYDYTASFESSDPSVASVDAETGEILGISEGKATISAKVKDWSGNEIVSEKEITVTPEPVLDEIIVSADTELLIGEDAEIEISAVMNDGEKGDISKYEISFSSTASSVATVSDGKIIAVGAGETIISITAVGESGKRCSKVLSVRVYDSLDPIVIDFSKTEVKLDYTQPEVTPGYKILTDIAAPTQYRMFDCSGRDMLQVRTGSSLWPASKDFSKSAFAFSFDARAEGDYSVSLFGGVFKSCAVYSVYVNGQYAGDYDFYDPLGRSSRTAGVEKKLNTVHLEKGENEVVMVIRENPGSMYLILRTLTFTPVENPLELEKISVALPEELAVGEVIDIEAYAFMNDESLRSFGPSYDGKEEDENNKLTITSANGMVEAENKTKVLNDGKNLFELTAKSEGKDTLTITAITDGKVYTETVSVEVKNDPIVSTGASPLAEELFAGDASYLIPKPTLSSGRVINTSSAVTTYKSLDESIATVNGDIITTHKEGTAEIEVTTTFGGVTVSGISRFTVQEEGMTSVSVTAGGSKTIRLTDKGSEDTVPLFVTATNNFGEEISLDGAKISAEVISDCAELDGELNIYPISEGEALFDVTVELPNGRIRSAEETLKVIYGKSESTYFTAEEAEIARENYKTYDWVKSEYASYITNAESYLDALDTLYDLIPSQGLPRAICVGDYNDPYAYTCRFCGTDIMAKHGQFSWQHNPITRPWKTQCPECKRQFPSNDFGSFYKLGLNEYGEFDRSRALATHREMLLEKGLIDTSIEAPGELWSESWLKYYGYGVKGGYLTNDLYSDLDEVTTLNGGQGLRPGEHEATWGVDDGYGYAPHDENGKPYVYNFKGEEIIERHTYIAVYNHFGLWRKHSDDKGRAGVIRNAIRYSSYAYFLTGDIKYGRVAAILLDRVSDFYPDYDIGSWDGEFAFANTDGGLDMGNIIGCIWECEEIVHLAKAYDMVYEVFDDPYVVKYLSDRSKQIKMTHAKESGSQIRTNIEDGLLRPALESLRDCSISGNFGLPQEANATLAVVLDSMPETAEWLDYLYAPGWMRRKDIESTGGSLDEVLMDDIDADGQGYEGSQYNNGWHTALVDIQKVLEDYDRYETASLWNNPKFCQMFYSKIPLITGYYTPQIGDSGNTASKDIWMTEAIALEGWKHFNDPVFAQILYLLNGRTAEGLHYDFTEENPERLEREVSDVIRKYGEFSQNSEAMTNFGFAVLRAGADYKSASIITEMNSGRDVWMYFGSSTGHGHLDTMNLGMRAFGLNFMPDLGYPRLTSGDPERDQWVDTTLAHNTVVVNEKGQKELLEPRGRIRHFDDDGMVSLMDVSAPYIYDEAEEYRRSVVTIRNDDETSYTVDFFRIIGGDSHTYSFHASSDSIAETKGLEFISQKDSEGNYIGTLAGADVPFGEDPGTGAGVLQYPVGYTWLTNIDRDEDPEDEFVIDFEIKDFNRAIKDSSNLHLKMTVLNASNASSGADTSVTITDGITPRKEENKNVRSLKYVLVKNEGKDLDSLFTTVFEPYRGNAYIEAATEIPMEITDGVEKESDAHRAIKVTFDGGKRVDYIFYSTNNAVTYKVSDVVNGVAQNTSFRGFVGVYTVNEKGSCIYSYVHDGDIIGEKAEGRYEIAGIVKTFTDTPEFENEIRILPEAMPTESELSEIVGKYVIIDNGAETRGGAYRIEGAKAEGDDLVLDIGRITPIRKYADAKNPEAGYVYLLASGMKARIPLSISDDKAPVFKELQDNLSASAGSNITVSINAESPIHGDTSPTITYIGEALPRGAALDSVSGALTWKPSQSQVGDNHFAVTARDSDGRESTIHFYITVYGSTSGGTGGGGGTTTPTTPSDKTENDKEPETNVGEDIILPPAESDVRFTDLGNHAWAEDAINSLADEGIIKGTSANTYSPANNITRADFALLLVRAFEKESDNTENFDDVSETDYFAKELAVARNTGLVAGIGDNKFAPRQSIKRCDMMLMVYRVIKDKFVGADIIRPQYADFDSVPDYAKEAVSALIGAGLVNGKNNLIAPMDNTTRAEVAVLLQRVLEFVEK